MYCPIFKLKIKLRKAISTEVNTEYNLWQITDCVFSKFKISQLLFLNK
jgi:hypothetical protein